MRFAQKKKISAVHAQELGEYGEIPLSGETSHDFAKRLEPRGVLLKFATVSAMPDVTQT